MTYSQGGLIQATDYNGFVGPTGSGGTAGANLNDIWGTGATDKGWGQTAVTNASVAGTVTATQWAALVNNLSSAGSQTSTASHQEQHLLQVIQLVFWRHSTQT